MSKVSETILSIISDCVGPILKKYIFKIFLYPLIIVYGYEIIKQLLFNSIDLTYNKVFSLTIVPFFVLMFLEVLNLIMLRDFRMDIVHERQENNQTDDSIDNLKACHEAGHFFIARTLKLPVKEVNIIKNGLIGGQVVLEMPDILKTSQIKSLVMVKYAGVTAEKILLGEASDGCIGSNTSDIETANELLKKYVILTDNKISLTGYEENYIRDKCSELSAQWLDEVEVLIKEGKDEVKDLAAQIFEKKVIKVADLKS